MEMKRYLLYLVLITLLVSCKKKDHIDSNNNEVNKIQIDQIGKCENKILNLLLKKQVNELLPYLPDEFIFRDVYEFSVIKKNNLSIELKKKESFWFKLLIVSKHSKNFEIKDQPDLTIPEFSVSDMLSRGHIFVDNEVHLNPKIKSVIITKYKALKDKGEFEYSYYIVFAKNDIRECELYGVGGSSVVL